MFNFSDWSYYFLLKLLYSVAIYFLITGSVYYVLWVRFKKRFSNKKIQKGELKKGQLRKEVLWSVSTNVFGALIITLIYFAQQQGLTRVYLNVADFGWPYFIFSILLIIIINDAYFFWVHLLFHKSKFLYSLHKVHHSSISPNPLTAQSQHPLEFIILSLFIPIVIFIIPTHPLAMLVFKVFSATFNIVGHLGYEFFPSGFTKGKYSKHLLTSTHHNMHHEFEHCNYGLYFSFWDRLMKSHHKKYHQKFEEIAGKN